ncbi:MAG: hypothetical protein CUN55_19845, partial [Phototrophicales bacterium]
ITVYKENNRYYVSYGNRRFLAMLIAHGEAHTVTVRVQPSKPDDLGISRFQENSQREDLPLRTLIEEFEQAYAELESRCSDNKSLSAQVIADALGISKSHAWALRSASQNSDLKQLLDEGVDIPKSKLKAIA